MTYGFRSPLRVEHINGKRWTLLEPLVYAAKSGATFRVPAGFSTDFASIPRAFHRLFPQSGEYNPAAVLHDYLYAIQWPRGRADEIFLEAMESVGCGWFTRRTMHRMVRLFGWKAYRDHGSEKREAEGV